MVAALMLSFGCSLSKDVTSESGRPPTREARDCYVDSRAIAPAPALPADREATLGDLLRLVDEGSVEVQQARAGLAQAAAAVREARSALRPSLVIAAGGLGYARPQGSSGFFSDQEVAEATVDLSFPLDVSGRLASSVRAAQARFRSSGQQLRSIERERRFVVAQAYFTLLAAEDLARVNDSAVAVQERALKDGRARLEVGVLRRNDVLVIEVALSNTRQRGVTLASAIRDARRALNVATGLPVDHPTRVSRMGSLIPFVADVVPLLDRARYDNPEVDVLVETREALLHELRANARANWPEVSLGPRITATTEGIATPAANFVGFVAASWNPDLNGRLQAERQGLSAQLLDQAWAMTGLLRSLEQRILKAHERTTERTSAFRSAETSLGQAKENQRIVLEQFNAGLNTGREVLEAQALLSQQEGTIETARHEVNAAQFELWYLAGLDPLDYYEQIAGPAESRPESR